ncbi:MAG: hypothetical protein E5Y83_19620 [Mesorhizobium sp.]|nr:MAG: hypothetical protein E5Y85_24300 [Mesorhizobium sp.]TIL51165.1 MAG: hypothetical protein E5Y83_19620 [Mesorhizobium sp.]
MAGTTRLAFPQQLIEISFTAVLPGPQAEGHVAVNLSISEITVKVRRGQVMQKMGATSLADLVNMAAKLSSHASARMRRAPGSLNSPSFNRQP